MAEHADNFKNDDLELMRRFDGELDSIDSLDSLEPLDSIEESALAEGGAAKLEALKALSEAFRDAMTHEAEAGADESSFAAMWSTIEHKITTNGAAEAFSKAPVSKEAQSDEQPGFFASIGAWFDRHRSQVMTGALAAAAAAALVWFVRPPEKTVEYVEVTAPRTADGPQLIPAKLQSAPAEVESLEVYDGSGVVLMIPSEGDNAPTTVIWLTPPENSVEGPI